MKTYVIQTTLPSVVRIRAEAFRFGMDARVLSFYVEGREVAAFPCENIVGVAEKPFGFAGVPDTDTEFLDQDEDDL